MSGLADVTLDAYLDMGFRVAASDGSDATPPQPTSWRKSAGVQVDRAGLARRIEEEELLLLL